MTPSPSTLNPANSNLALSRCHNRPPMLSYPPVSVSHAHLPRVRGPGISELSSSSNPLLLVRRRCSRHGRRLLCDGRQLHRLGVYWWRDGNDGALRRGRRRIEALFQVVPTAPRRLSRTRSPFHAGEPAAGVAGCVKVFVKSSVNKESGNGEWPYEASEKDHCAEKKSSCPVSGQTRFGLQKALQRLGSESEHYGHEYPETIEASHKSQGNHRFRTHVFDYFLLGGCY
jgi:hypothetical protein